MKIAKLLPTLLLGICFCSCCLESQIGFASNQMAVIKAVGEAVVIGEKDKANALENAKLKAVKKVTSRFIVSSEEPDSIYQKIISNYNKYIRGNVKVYKTQKSNGKIYMFCDVAVDYGEIQEDATRSFSGYQNKNLDDSAIFLIRIVGLPNLHGDEKKIPIMVLNDYGMAFSNNGFSTYSSDAGENSYQLMADTANRLNTVNYLEYRERVIKDLLQDVSVTYAVIGEIKLNHMSSNASGEYVEADCTMEVIRPSADSTRVDVIGRFCDKYNVTARNKKEAVAIVCKKAAVNSAKVLADITYKFWKNQVK